MKNIMTTCKVGSQYFYIISNYGYLEVSIMQWIIHLCQREINAREW